MSGSHPICQMYCHMARRIYNWLQFSAIRLWRTLTLPWRYILDTLCRPNTGHKNPRRIHMFPGSPISDALYPPPVASQQHRDRSVMSVRARVCVPLPLPQVTRRNASVLLALKGPLVPSAPASHLRSLLARQLKYAKWPFFPSLSSLKCAIRSNIRGNCPQLAKKRERNRGGGTGG